jgi:hypothetical protein
MSEKITVCPSCGSDKFLHIKEDLNKCMMCGQYLTDHGVPPKLTVASSLSQVKELATKSAEEALEVSPAQWTFINKVARRLSYAPKMQRHYRETLASVFREEITMQQWLGDVGVETGLKEEDLRNILNEEFANTPEAVKEAGKKSLF